MKTKHIFVPVLDVGELLPFAIPKSKNLLENMKQQEVARKEMEKFIDILEKNYGESIYYMGMDIIESKTYERFVFAKGGFLEIMTEAPVAINSHFVDQKKAEKFCKGLKKSLSAVLKKNPIAKMFIDSIQVSSESEQSLTYEKWDKMKGIRNSK